MKEQVTALKNRLLKNQKKLKSYVRSLEAYRLYHKDIPEYPYIIDLYKDHALIYEQGRSLYSINEQIREEHLSDIISVLKDIFNIPSTHLHYRLRERKKGKNQYEKIHQQSLNFYPIQEYSLKFLINLDNYLDSGLFLDHRPLRQYLTKNTRNKKILNLFSYTGSLSVAAAYGGGIVTSVDLSKTYLNWSKENFIANNLSLRGHRFIQADILEGMKRFLNLKEKFDMILLDPPSFSNSKKMKTELDVERDHSELIKGSMSLLQPEGILIFSTNKKKFKLNPYVLSHYNVQETTHWTIPLDFKRTHIHQSFFIKHLPQSK